MKTKALIFWSVVLGVVLAVFWATQRGKTSRRGLDDRPGEPLLTQDKGNLKEITLTNHGRPTFTLVNKDREWFFKQGGFKTDRAHVDDLLKSLDQLSAISSFPLDGGHPKSLYGLSKVSDHYKLVFEDGEQEKFTIGKKAPVPGNQYVHVEGNPKVVVVSEADLVNLNQTDQLLRNKVILEGEDKDVIAFAFGQERWSRPENGTFRPWKNSRNLPLDDGEMNLLAGLFGPLEAMSFAPASVTVPVSASALTVGLSGGKQEKFRLWADKTRSYALHEGDSQVYYLPDSAILDNLKKPMLEDNVIPYYQEDMESLVFETPSGILKATRDVAQSRWLCEGAGLLPSCSSALQKFIEGLSFSVIRSMVAGQQNAPDKTLYNLTFNFTPKAKAPPQMVLHIGPKAAFYNVSVEPWGVSYPMESNVKTMLKVLERNVFAKVQNP